MKRLRLACTLLIATGCAADAAAQIYTGTDDSGVVTLSTTRTGDADQLLLGSAMAPSSPAPAVAARSALRYDLPIASASAATGVPEALIRAVIQVESAFNEKAVSRKGALGLMQVMPATARRFGIENLSDPASNILAGARYLRYLLDLFDQDVALALAAYNAGENAVWKAGRRIPAYAETAQYVPKVLGGYRRLLQP